MVRVWVDRGGSKVFRKRKSGRKVYKSKANLYNLNKRVSRLARQGEVKWRNVEIDAEAAVGDGNLNALNSSTSNCIVPLASIPKGDTASEREGNEVRLTSFKFRMYIVQEPSVITNLLDDGYNMVRIMIVRFKDNRLTPTVSPPLGSVLESRGSAALNVLANYNNYGRGNYKVMYDKTFSLTDFGTFINTDATPDARYNWGNNTTVRYLKKKIKFNHKALFDSTNPQAITNTPWLYIFSTSTQPNHPTVRLVGRTSFKED